MGSGEAEWILLLKKKGPMKWQEFSHKYPGIKKERFREIVSEIHLKDNHVFLDALVHRDETPWVRTVMNRLQERDGCGLKWKEVQVGLEGVTKKKLGLLPELFTFDKAKHHVFLFGESNSEESQGEEEEGEAEKPEKEKEKKGKQKKKKDDEGQDTRSGCTNDWSTWVVSDRNAAGFRKKLMKSRNSPAKAEILEWLWNGGHEGSMWNSLRRAAEGKEWKKFGQIIRKTWVQSGGKEQTCNCLQGSQHCMQIWRGIAAGY